MLPIHNGYDDHSEHDDLAECYEQPVASEAEVIVVLIKRIVEVENPRQHQREYAHAGGNLEHPSCKNDLLSAVLFDNPAQICQKEEQHDKIAEKDQEIGDSHHIISQLRSISPVQISQRLRHIQYRICHKETKKRPGSLPVETSGKQNYHRCYNAKDCAPKFKCNMQILGYTHITYLINVTILPKKPPPFNVTFRLVYNEQTRRYRTDGFMLQYYL